MSGAPATGAAPPTTKAIVSDATTQPTKDQKPAAALEEDDEFEDFPVESTFMLDSCWGIRGAELEGAMGRGMSGGGRWM